MIYLSMLFRKEVKMTITVNYKKHEDNVNVHTKYNRYVEAFDWATGDTYVIPENYATQSLRTLAWYVKDGLKTSELELVSLRV